MKQKDKIINFVLECILKDRAQEITMNSIAEKMKISLNSLYSMFPSEEELLRQAMETYLHVVLGTQEIK